MTLTRRLVPAVVLVTVTGLLVPFGSTSWAWIGGPLAAMAIWLLDLRRDAPAEPAPARRGASYAAAEVVVEPNAVR